MLLKIIRPICAAMACAAFASAAFADVKTDQWDVSQGCEITGASTWGFFPGTDPRNMFGGEYGTMEVGNAVFVDAQIFGPGTVSWISWKTPTEVDLIRFVLSVAADGNYPATYNRAIQGFNLYASDVAHPYEDNWGTPIYASGLLQAPLGEFNNGIYSYSIDHIFSSPVTAQYFKADFVHGSSVTGPRIIELDGYSVPEPASILIIALGSLSLLRRHRAK